MKRRSIIIVIGGLFFLGACGEGVVLTKQTTESETCVYEQKYHKFDDAPIGKPVLIACTPDTSRGAK